MGDKCYDDPYGLQKLRESAMVAVAKEWSCCSSSYVVSSHVGILCKSDGSYHHHRMYDNDGRLVMGLNFKRPWFETAYMLIQVVNCPLIKICVKSSFTSSLLVVNQHEQPILKIKVPTVSNNIKILQMNDVEVGRMKKDWGEWNVHFPVDLETEYKAALIGACIYFDLRTAERNRRIEGR